MATYAIGDVQGCFDPLETLLTRIGFNPAEDTLWFAGDLVNRGPDSLKTLRFIKHLGTRAQVVLGNHDLHLLRVAYGIRTPAHTDTLDAILSAPDRIELIDWLRHQPLLVYSEQLHYGMTHAGIPHIWSLTEAKGYAREVEQVLQGDNLANMLPFLFGSTPNQWCDTQQATDRLRLIVNYFTRMRFITAEGQLEFAHKASLEDAPSGYLPWFQYPHKTDPAHSTPARWVFGHWAALNGLRHQDRVFGLDTGCAWGLSLTALRLEDQTLFSCPCASQI